MTDMSTPDIHRAIGRLEGRFDSFDTALKTVSDQIVAHDTKTTNGQAALRVLIEDKAEGLADDINQLGVRVVDLEKHENFGAGGANVKARLIGVSLKVVQWGLPAGGVVAIIMGFAKGAAH